MAQNESNTMFGYTPSQAQVTAPVANVMGKESGIDRTVNSLSNLLLTREKTIQAEVSANEEDRYWEARNKFNSYQKQYRDTLTSTNDVNVHNQALSVLTAQAFNLSKEYNLTSKHAALLDKTINDFSFTQRASLTSKLETIETNTRINNAVGAVPTFVGESTDVTIENLDMLRKSLTQSGTMHVIDANKLLSSSYLNGRLVKFDYKNSSLAEINTIREETDKVLSKFDPKYLTSNDYVSFNNKLNQAEELYKAKIKQTADTLVKDVGVDVGELRDFLDSNIELFPKEIYDQLINTKKVANVTSRLELAIDDVNTKGDYSMLKDMNEKYPTQTVNVVKKAVGNNLNIWKQYKEQGVLLDKVAEIDNELQAINNVGGIQSTEELIAWKQKYDHAVSVGYPVRGQLAQDALVLSALYKRSPDTAFSEYQQLKRNPREVTDKKVDKFYKDKFVDVELLAPGQDIDIASAALMKDAIKPLIKAFMAAGVDSDLIIEDINTFIDNQFMEVGTNWGDRVLVPKTDEFFDKEQYNNVLKVYQGAEAVVPLDITNLKGKWKILKEDGTVKVLDYGELINASKGFKAHMKDSIKPSRNKPLTPEEAVEKKKDIVSLINQVGYQLNMGEQDIIYSTAVANIESELGTHKNTYDNSRSYRGLFQIGNKLLQDINKRNKTSFTMEDVNDDYKATQIYMKYLYPFYKKQYNNLVPNASKKREIDITPLDTYLIHQQGIKGFNIIKSNEDMSIDEFATKYPNIYNNMSNNYYGKTPMRYVKDFTSDWNRIKNKKLKEVLDITKKGI